MIALIDYGSGNLRSVHKALLKVGADVRIVQRPEEMAEARAVVLPGVGAFDDCIHALEKQELLETQEKEKAEIGRRIKGLLELYYQGGITPQSFGIEHHPLDERKNQLEDEIPRLEGEIDFLKIQYLSSDEILTEARDLFTRWKELSSEERRKIVENITERIAVGKDDVTIELAYMPPSSEIAATKQRNLTGSWPRPT